jgi:hypothetical protein
MESRLLEAMMTFRTRIFVTLLIVACVGFSAIVVADPSKPFPVEEVNPRLSTSLQALALAAQEGQTALKAMAE